MHSAEVLVCFLECKLNKEGHVSITAGCNDEGQMDAKISARFVHALVDTVKEMHLDFIEIVRPDYGLLRSMGAYRALCACCARSVRKVGCSPPPGVR